jgi:glucose-1-phosphate thymidylyltransferase
MFFLSGFPIFRRLKKTTTQLTLMKLVIPMAGKGTRLRPHSHTTPKPLLPIAGVSIVERIIDTFARTLDREITEVIYILGETTDEVRNSLAAVAERHGATHAFYYQEEALGTAHAIYSAAPALQGEMIAVFADTLFDTKEKVSVEDADSVIWLKEVEDPSRFGVAVHEGDTITGFVEKPATPISKLAIIGVYYFKDGAILKRHIQRLLDENITGHGSEYQLTDALDSMIKEGLSFKAATVDEWLDCGTIPAWLETSKVILEKEQHGYPEFDGSVEIKQPVYIGKNVTISNSVIGPYASIGDGCEIKGSTIQDTVIREHSQVLSSKLLDCTVGEHASIKDFAGTLHIGDHSKVG